MTEKNIELPFGFIETSEIIGKNIIIFGTGHASELLVKLLGNICYIHYYCDNNAEKWGKHFNGNLIISPAELSGTLKRNKDWIIIIASAFNFEIKKQLLEKLHISNQIIISDQLIPVLYEKRYKNDFCKDTFIEEGIYRERYLFNKFELVNFPPQLVMYAPPKVGNISVNVGLGYKAFVATIFSMYHSMDRLRFDEKEKKICASKVKKIIIGVRDAVAQNISMVFEIQDFYCLLLGKDGRDAQKVFHTFVEESICHEKTKRQKREYGFEQFHHTPFLIQSWFDDVFLKDFKIDIFQLPFDKKKGYSIYKNIEGYDILIYQLEKLNNLESIFRDFTEKKNFQIKKQNDSEKKWYAESYNNFKENIKINNAYLEKTYSGKMMKHFYSEEDIIKFRNKWEKHTY